MSISVSIGVGITALRGGTVGIPTFSGTFDVQFSATGRALIADGDAAALASLAAFGAGHSFRISAIVTAPAMPERSIVDLASGATFSILDPDHPDFESTKLEAGRWGTGVNSAPTTYAAGAIIRFYVAIVQDSINTVVAWSQMQTALRVSLPDNVRFDGATLEKAMTFKMWTGSGMSFYVKARPNTETQTAAGSSLGITKAAFEQCDWEISFSDNAAEDYDFQYLQDADCYVQNKKAGKAFAPVGGHIYTTSGIHTVRARAWFAGQRVEFSAGVDELTTTVEVIDQDVIFAACTGYISHTGYHADAAAFKAAAASLGIPDDLPLNHYIVYTDGDWADLRNKVGAFSIYHRDNGDPAGAAGIGGLAARVCFLRDHTYNATNQTAGMPVYVDSPEYRGTCWNAAGNGTALPVISVSSTADFKLWEFGPDETRRHIINNLRMEHSYDCVTGLPLLQQNLSDSGAINVDNPEKCRGVSIFRCEFKGFANPVELYGHAHNFCDSKIEGWYDFGIVYGAGSMINVHGVAILQPKDVCTQRLPNYGNLSLRGAAASKINPSVPATWTSVQTEINTTGPAVTLTTDIVNTWRNAPQHGPVRRFSYNHAASLQQCWMTSYTGWAHETGYSTARDAALVGEPFDSMTAAERAWCGFDGMPCAQPCIRDLTNPKPEDFDGYATATGGPYPEIGTFATDDIHIEGIRTPIVSTFGNISDKNDSDMEASGFVSSRITRVFADIDRTAEAIWAGMFNAYFRNCIGRMRNTAWTLASTNMGEKTTIYGFRSEEISSRDLSGDKPVVGEAITLFLERSVTNAYKGAQFNAVSRPASVTDTVVIRADGVTVSGTDETISIAAAGTTATGSPIPGLPIRPASGSSLLGSGTGTGSIDFTGALRPAPAAQGALEVQS